MSFLVLFSPLFTRKYEKLNSQKLKHSSRESVFNLVYLFSPFYYQYTIYPISKRSALLFDIILLPLYYYLFIIILWILKRTKKTKKIQKRQVIQLLGMQKW